MGADTSRRVSFADLKAFGCQAYMKAGVPAAEAEIVAGLLVRSDLSGVETHGVTRLPIYIQRLQNGYNENEYLIPMWKPDERSNRFSNALG